MEQTNCRFKIGDLVMPSVGTITIYECCTIVEIHVNERCNYKLKRQDGGLINKYFFDEDLKLC